MKHLSSSTRLLATALCGFSLLVGCKPKEATPPATDSTAQKATVAQPIMMIAADSSPEFPNAKLQIVSPREGQVLKNANDSVAVVMNVTGMELAKPTEGDATRGIAFSKDGAHVHVIIDEKPYMADYKNGQPFMVGVLAPGKHTIRAFPSRSWHESVKTAGAFATRTFYVGEAPKKGMKDSTATDLKGPLLTYSRPKGTYSAKDAEKLLLDFYVSNCKLAADGYHVAVSIDGKDMGTIANWAPRYITGLTSGKHTIALKLLDAKGNVVPGAYNSPSAEITVQ